MSEDLIGRKLGNFEIVDVLGYGGMATVYRARQQTIQRDVAVKVMNRELSTDEEFILRFEREADIFAELQHPHILPVIEFGRTDDDWVYMVVRLAEGGSLDKYIRRQGPISLDKATKMLSQMASALTFAHEKAVVHRDMKTSNVLLDGRDNTYIMDFGIAKMLASTMRLTATHDVLGTPAYMSPEQWRGEAIDARTDIYALGIVTYEMLSGDLPYTAETPFTMMYKHMNEAPPSLQKLKDIPEAVETVILQAIAKDPDSRFQSAEAFSQAFAAAASGKPIPVQAGVSAPASPKSETEKDDPVERTVLVNADETVPNVANVTTPLDSQIVTSQTIVHKQQWSAPVIMLGVIAIVLAIVVGALVLRDDGGGDSSSNSNANTGIIEDRDEDENDDEEDVRLTVVADNAPLYDRAGPGGSVVGQVGGGEQYTVLAISHDRNWVQINYTDGLRWIEVRYAGVEGDLDDLPIVPLPGADGGSPVLPPVTPQPPPATQPPPPGPGAAGDSPRVERVINFPDLELEFVLPDGWATVPGEDDETIVLEPVGQRGPISRASIEIWRWTTADLQAELGIDVPDDALLIERAIMISQAYLQEVVPLDVEMEEPTTGFHYPLIIGTGSIDEMRVTQVMIEYDAGDYVFLLAEVSPGTAEQILRENVLMLLRSMRIEGNALAIHRER